MATFNTVWSLDVGRSSLKAVKLRREKNNIEILAVDKIDYTPGQNGVDFTSKAREAISVFRVRNDVKEPVIVAHNGQGTLSRFIKVPAFESRKVKEMVGYEASQQIPFPLDEVVWDYHVIDRDYLPGEEREVGLFAARRETIDDFLVDFTNEQLAVEGLTIGYLGLLNYIFYDIDPQEPAMVLDLGGSHTDLILVDGKKFWIRALPHSGNEISKAIMERLKVGFAEAEKLKADISKNPKQAAKLFAAVIQPKLKDLVNQIHQSVGFYKSQVGETQFKQLYLVGNASRVVGLKKFLEEHLRVKVNRVQTINHLRISRDVDVQLLQTNLPAFGTAFGAALQGVGAGSCKVDLIPQEEKLEKEYQRKKVHVFVAIGLLFVVTFVAGLLVRGKVDGARSAADNANTFLAPIVRADGELKKIEELQIGERVETLIRTAALRDRPFAALSMVGDILSALPVSDTVTRRATLVDEGANKQTVVNEVKEAMNRLLGEKLWVTSARIEKVMYPEDAKKKDVIQVPAYKVAIFVMVTQQETETQSLNLIQQRLQTSLARRLKASGLTLDSEVRVSPEFQGGRPVLLRREHEKQGVGVAYQESGPFAGVELTLYLRAEDPPKPVVEETDDKKKKRRP